jgi:hypothetical protein
VREKTRPFLPLLRPPQVGVEDHAHVPHEELPERRDLDPIGSQPHESFHRRPRRQFRQLGGEVAIEVEVEAACNVVLPEDEVAHELRDHRPPDVVVGAQLEAALDRELAGGERRVVGR